MKTLVTGDTGFVGAWTAKVAKDAGHQVRFLVRTPARLGGSAEQIGVDISDYVVGDIAGSEATAAALEGCDAVIRCAAMVSVDPVGADEMLHTIFRSSADLTGTAISSYSQCQMSPDVISDDTVTGLQRVGRI